MYPNPNEMGIDVLKYKECKVPSLPLVLTVDSSSALGVTGEEEHTPTYPKSHLT